MCWRGVLFEWLQVTLSSVRKAPEVKATLCHRLH